MILPLSSESLSFSGFGGGWPPGAPPRGPPLALGFGLGFGFGRAEGEGEVFAVSNGALLSLSCVSLRLANRGAFWLLPLEIEDPVVALALVLFFAVTRNLLLSAEPEEAESLLSFHGSESLVTRRP